MRTRRSARHLRPRLILCALCAVPLSFAPPVLAAPVDELLKLARERSESLKSLELSVRAAEETVRARELELSPKLASELGMIRDNRESLLSSRQTSNNFIDISLSKLFASGTTFTLSAGNTAAETTTAGSQNTAEWEARISQSLWRNAFGRGTRLRRDSDQSELRARKFQLEFQRQTLLVGLEDLYWDLALALQEEQTRLRNIERSDALERWIRDRVRRAAAERADLLQVEGLSSDRRLSLLEVRGRIARLQNSLREAIPGFDPKDFKISEKTLDSDRDARALMTGSSSQGDPIRLDTLAARFTAREARAEAARAADTVSPLLDAYAAYGRNGIRPEPGEAWNRATGSDFSQTQVGLLLSLDLDRGLTSAQRRASELEAEAAELAAQASARGSMTLWSELNRNIAQLREQLTEARKSADIHRRNAQAEQKRYQLGRITAFQAVTIEIAASESELEVYRLLNALRKAEARARLYTRDIDGET
ncbi:MAG TPA: TolC family protein [Bdellovibrionales bacterium]|nr:TolC family protein [Bdellovibrionales bacterium]